MDLDRLSRPCPTSRCDHSRGCWEGDKRRAEAGHAAALVASPKMDAWSLVAAACSCGQYRSGPSTEPHALAAWRQHADAKIAAAAGQP